MAAINTEVSKNNFMASSNESGSSSFAYAWVHSPHSQ
jgi:hypothetical protein